MHNYNIRDAFYVVIGCLYGANNAWDGMFERTDCMRGSLPIGNSNLVYMNCQLAVVLWRES